MERREKGGEGAFTTLMAKLYLMIFTCNAELALQIGEFYTNGRPDVSVGLRVPQGLLFWSIREIKEPFNQAAIMQLM